MKNVDQIATRQMLEIWEEHHNPEKDEKKEILKKRESKRSLKRKDCGV